MTPSICRCLSARGSVGLRRVAACLLGLLMTLGSVHAASLAEALVDDATLNDVQMLDARRGWAVGDHGAILSTEDGGANWRVQASPVNASLQAVTFVDARRGWAVGGLMQPSTRLPMGVVMRTENGGRTWTALPQPTLPALRAVRFFDDKHGMAAGVGAAFAPGGVFETSDGGKHWRSLSADRTCAWNAADFVRNGREQFALLVGPRGSLGRTQNGRIEPCEPATDLRGLQAVAWASAGRAWLVGDGGLLRTSTNGGQSWEGPKSGADESLDGWFDWRTVTAHRDRVWIAGVPGSHVVRSTNGGRTWQQHPTGVTTPINSIDFVDERHGVAVGEFGMVLTTDDGGETWLPRRGGDRHAAVLSLVGVESQLAPELIAATALAAGRRTVVASPISSTEAIDVANSQLRLAQVSQQLGVSAFCDNWRLPLEPHESRLGRSRLLGLLDARHGVSADADAKLRIARLLAVYRPSVVLVPAASEAHPGLTEWVRSLVKSAAAGEVALPPAAELEVHRPRHVLMLGGSDRRSATRERGENRFSTGDFIGSLGATSAQWSEPVRRLLHDVPGAAPEHYSWRPLVGRPVAGRRGDLADATGAPRGAADRRPASDPPTGRIDQLRRLGQRQRAIDQLLAVEEIDEEWSRRVLDLTMGLDSSLGAALLEQLAIGYREIGRADHAAETRFLLARRYPGEPLADAALVWLVRYYASSECGWAALTARDAAERRDALANVSSALRFTPRDPENELTLARRRERGRVLAKYLESDRPALYADPSLGLGVASTQRADGAERDAERAAEWISRQPVLPGWRRAAGAERWLSDAKSLPPDKPVARCQITASRPQLDAVLDEPAWRDAEAIEFEDSDGQRTEVRFCRDDEFLYFGIEASADSPPKSGNKRRPRDANLEAFDRVTLRLDLDRDYTTAYELSVDCRGYTHDAVWGDRHWRPEWYVANESGPESWRVEAAIALSSIVGADDLEHAGWAVSVERRRPDRLPASWTGSPGETPDAFGLLILE